MLGSALAQKPDEFKQPRILILLDGSSSMVNIWTENRTRFEAAGKIITTLMDSIYQINDEVEFSLRVYGHQFGVPENNCFDTKREVMFSKNNLTQMSLRLESLRPIGVSPIAYSLQQAAETDFASERDYAYSLILITDGGESCGGNICEVVRTLLEKKIQFRPYIVSLVDYAPLRDQYACLGTYLQVSAPSELEPAINAIAEGYRKVLKVPVAKPKLTETKVTLPVVAKKTPEPIIVRPEPEVVKEEPTPRPAEQPKPEPVKETPPPPASTSKIKVDAFIKEKFTPISGPGLDRIRYSLYWSTTTPKRRPVPKFPAPPRMEDPTAANRPATATTPKPVNRPVAKSEPREEPVEATYTVKTETAAETLLEVYFTDGRGRYYSSTPPMQLVDPRTGAEVKRFYRTTDAKGNPDPQTVPAGNYTLVIGKAGKFVSKNLTVVANNRNKVEIVVTKGSLSFAYEGNLKRPVSEFTAAVRKNFEPGPTVGQQCTVEREYEPGNYHVEINTLPISRRTVDLDFGMSVRIDIDEPGFVKFTNENNIGKVALFYPLGDQFVRFYAIDIKGNVDAQKLRLQPGVYEARYQRNPNIPVPDEVIQKFVVKSNDTTEVELQ